MAERKTETRAPRPPLVSIFGANVFLRRRRMNPEMSQEKLAYLSGLARETVRRIEAARNTDRAMETPASGLDTVDQIAETLGCDPDELLRYDSATRAYLSAENVTLTLIPGEGSDGSPNGQGHLLTL